MVGVIYFFIYKKFPGLTPDPLNEKFWRWGPAISVFKSLPGDCDKIKLDNDCLLHTWGNQGAGKFTSLTQDYCFLWKVINTWEMLMIQASQRKQEKKSMYIVNSTKLKNVAKETRLEEYMPECLSDLKVKSLF